MNAKHVALTILLLPVAVLAQAQDSWRAAVYASFEQVAEINYGRSTTATALFIEGEPIVLRIGITNPYTDRNASAEQRWPSLVSLVMTEGSMRHPVLGSQRTVQCKSSEIQPSAAVRLRNGLVDLPPGARQFFLCAVDPIQNRLVAGTYTIAMHWSPSIDTQTLRVPNQLDLLGGALDFEYRPIGSEADAADLSMRLALRALAEGRIDDANRSIQDVLTSHPLSSSALAVKGRILAKQGDCRGAATSLNRAADVLDRRIEGDDNNPRHRADKERADIALRWRQEALQLNCR